MKKIISLFQRNYDGDRLVRDEVTPGAEWVLNGEGIATRKWDGTCCMIKDGVLYKRYDAKLGKIPPEGFIPAQEFPDEKTGHWPGWVKVGDGPEDEWHREAKILQEMCALGLLGVNNLCDMGDGTYELCGPKINGNNEGFDRHMLIKHGEKQIPLNYDPDPFCFFYHIKAYLIHRNHGSCIADNFVAINHHFARNRPIEGIVWHHPDGRMVKIKAKDFGIKWGK